jgi:hypothetical protein
MEKAPHLKDLAVQWVPAKSPRVQMVKFGSTSTLGTGKALRVDTVAQGGVDATNQN